MMRTSSFGKTLTRIGSTYLDDETDDPAYPLAGEQLDYEGDFPDPVENEEDAGVDHCLNAEVIMETDRGPQFARVVERAKHPDGRKIGSPHRNPMLDTRECFLEFPDQSRKRHSANVIAENLCSQCDSEGCRFNVLKKIVDHWITSEALHGEDAYKTLKNGEKVPKQTTKGDQLLLQFCGSETEWMHL